MEIHALGLVIILRFLGCRTQVGSFKCINSREPERKAQVNKDNCTQVAELHCSIEQTKGDPLTSSPKPRRASDFNLRRARESMFPAIGRRTTSGDGDSLSSGSNAVRGEIEVEAVGYEDRKGAMLGGDGFTLLPVSSRHPMGSDCLNGIGVGDDGGGGGSGRSDDGRQHLSSDMRTFINLLIAFVGAGILGIPYAFRQGGLYLSAGVLSVVGLACTYCMWMLVRSKYRVIAIRTNALFEKEKHVQDDPGPVTYADVCQEALGRPGLLILESALVASQSGFATAYIVFIARNFHALFDFQKAPVVLLCLPGLIMLCLIKHLKYLAPFSLVAEVVNLTGLAVVFFDDAEFLGLSHPSISMGHWKALPFVFGVGVYCFEGMGMVIPIESSMENRLNFMPILSLVMIIYTLLCVLSGALGYLAFGDGTEDIILLNIGDTASAFIVKMSFCIGLYFTFPIMMVPVWEVLEFKWLRRQAPSFDRNRNVLRAAVVCGTGLLAYGVPNFGLFVSLVGSSCCALLAFILPTLCYARLEKDAGFPLGAWRLFLNNLILVSGVFAMVSGTLDTLHRIALEFEHGGGSAEGDGR